MPLRFYYIRFIRFSKKYGYRRTIERIYERLYLLFFRKKDWVFYCDLTLLNIADTKDPDNIKIERKHNENQIEQKDLSILIEHIGEETIWAWLRQRFAESATLWLIKVDDKLAGYQWTIGKSKVESLNPYYFPLGNRDVFTFDAVTLPEYRGRNLSPISHRNVFRELKNLGFVRAIGEVHEWNFAMHKVLAKAGMKRLGVVRRYRFGRRNYLLWEKEI